MSAEFNYRTAIDKVVYKPGWSVFELIMPETALRAGQFVQSIRSRKGRGAKATKLFRIPISDCS